MCGGQSVAGEFLARFSESTLKTLYKENPVYAFCVKILLEAQMQSWMTSIFIQKWREFVMRRRVMPRGSMHISQDQWVKSCENWLERTNQLSKRVTGRGPFIDSRRQQSRFICTRRSVKKSFVMRAGFSHCVKKPIVILMATNWSGWSLSSTEMDHQSYSRCSLVYAVSSKAFGPK